MSMPSPIISVIIPAYNVDEYISECLESLVRQSLAQDFFEVIVVNDCSTDLTLEKIESFRTSYPLKIINNKVNIGPGLSRNRGISVANGEFLFFLDADDLLTVNALDIVSQQVQNSDVDLLVYNWNFYHDFKNNIYLGKNNFKNIPINQDDAIKSCMGLRGVDYTNGYKAVRRTLFIENNLQYAQGTHEDILMTFKVFYFSKSVKKIDEILYIRRLRDNARSNSFTEQNIDGFVGSIFKMMDYLVERLGEAKAYEYKRYYDQGISGMIANMINKILVLPSLDNRVPLYLYLYKYIEEDRYFNPDVLVSFQNLTKKDKLTKVFIEIMQDKKLSAKKKIVKFEAKIS